MAGRRVPGLPRTAPSPSSRPSRESPPRRLPRVPKSRRKRQRRATTPTRQGRVNRSISHKKAVFARWPCTAGAARGGRSDAPHVATAPPPVRAPAFSFASLAGGCRIGAMPLAQSPALSRQPQSSTDRSRGGGGAPKVTSNCREGVFQAIIRKFALSNPHPSAYLQHPVHPPRAVIASRAAESPSGLRISASSTLRHTSRRRSSVRTRATPRVVV